MAAIFGPALLFGLLHLDLAQGLTAFVCGLFLGWLAERTGSVLPGMLLHFLKQYDRLSVSPIYKPMPPAALPWVPSCLCCWPSRRWRSGCCGVQMRQGFRFSAGLRPRC